MLKKKKKKRTEYEQNLAVSVRNNNPYLNVIRSAEASVAEHRKIVRQRDNWYDNPLNFLDIDELFYPDGLMRTRSGLMAIAGEIFSENRGGTPDILEDILHGSMPGSKDVQKTVLMKMFRDALSAFSKKATKAQIEAIVLAREAIRNGVTPTMYIADQRGINRFSAYKLLKRAEQALLETSGIDQSIIKIEKRIKARARSMKRFCVSCGKPCEDGLHALCPECHVRFVFRDDYLHETHRQQIQDAMRIASMQHWRKARSIALRER